MSLAQGNNTPTRRRIEPGSPNPESDALTIRPVRPPISKALMFVTTCLFSHQWETTEWNKYLPLDRPSQVSTVTGVGRPSMKLDIYENITEKLMVLRSIVATVVQSPRWLGSMTWRPMKINEGRPRTERRAGSGSNERGGTIRPKQIPTPTINRWRAGLQGDRELTISRKKGNPGVDHQEGLGNRKGHPQA